MTGSPLAPVGRYTAVRWIGTQSSSLNVIIPPPISRANAINDSSQAVGGYTDELDEEWLNDMSGWASVVFRYKLTPCKPSTVRPMTSTTTGSWSATRTCRMCLMCITPSAGLTVTISTTLVHWIPVARPVSSEATAINDAGRIVGSSSFDPHAFTLEPVFHAFLWRRLLLIEASDLGASPFVDLGTLCRYTNHLCNSRARDINIHNHIVGQSETTTSSDAEPVGFIHQGTTMKDIHTLLSPVDRAQWRLTEARAINDLGQIVGTGYFQGDKQRAYLLTPPVTYIVNLVKALPVLCSPDLVEEQRTG